MCIHDLILGSVSEHWNCQSARAINKSYALLVSRVINCMTLQARPQQIAIASNDQFVRVYDRRMLSLGEAFCGRASSQRRPAICPPSIVGYFLVKNLTPKRFRTLIRSSAFSEMLAKTFIYHTAAS